MGDEIAWANTSRLELSLTVYVESSELVVWLRGMQLHRKI